MSTEYEFTPEEENRVGDYLLTELAARDGGAITESMAKNIISKENILQESKSRRKPVNESATQMTAHEYLRDGVTITPQQFFQVYTDPDKHRTAREVLRALHFPEYVLSRPENSLKRIVSDLSRRTSMLSWYNSLIPNNAPLDRLVPWADRAKAYSRAAKIAAERTGEVYEPTVNQIDPGRKGRKNRTTNVIKSLNDKEVLAGEFYNNISRIPRRNWNHWLKFWDRRVAAVQPNKRKLLGRLIGRTWGKTFLLGYQVDSRIVYEVWYNSLDSTFSVYDKNGVEMGHPVVTLQEAVRDLIHVIAQASSADREAFGVGKTGSDLAQSINRTFGNVMQQDVGVMQREKDLQDKEIAKDAQKDLSTSFKTNVKNAIRASLSTSKQQERDKEEQENNRNNDTALNDIEHDLKQARSKKFSAVGSHDAEYWQEVIDQLEQDKEDEMRKRSGGGFTKKKAKPKVRGDQDVGYRNNYNKQEKDAKRKEDIANAVKSGQEAMDNAQVAALKRQIDAEIELRQNEMQQMQAAMDAAQHNLRQNDPNDLMPLDPKYGVPEGTIGTNDDGSRNPQYRDLYRELNQAWKQTGQEVNKLQSFSKNPQKLKQALGKNAENLFDKDQIRKIVNSSFDDDGELILEMDDGLDLLAQELEAANDPTLDNFDQYDERKYTRVADQRRTQAKDSSYTKSLLMTDISGSISTYDVTKIKRASLVSVMRDKFDPMKKSQRIKPGFWSRAWNFFRGETFRADFIIGWSLGGKINMEIWYVTEPDPHTRGKLISSYYVYDVNAQTVIRKYIPYYRLALATIASKMGVQGL